MSGRKILEGLHEALEVSAYTTHATDAAYACFCVGPQDGNPVCPCRMRGLRQKDGRWIEVIDHGPVRPPANPNPQTEEK